MIVRRSRRSTLALLLLIALCVGGFAVCYSAEGEPFPGDGPTADASPTAERPSPFYEDEQAPEDTEARAERTPPAPLSSKIPGVRIFSKPARTPTVSPANAPSAGDSPAVSNKSLPSSKTPLPKSLDVGAREFTGSDSPPGARGSTNYRSAVIWAVGILIAGVIIKQVFMAGGSLTNSAPSAVEVLSRQSLGPQQQVSLVRFGRRLLLVGTTSTSMTTLAQVDDPEEVQALLTELQSSSSGRRPKAFGLFRQRRSRDHSRAERTRWADANHSSPAASVSLSTESRTAAHERRSPSPPSHEVNDG